MTTRGSNMCSSIDVTRYEVEILPDPATDFVVEPGTFIRADLMLCTTTTRDTTQGRVEFNAHGTNPNWFNQDRLYLQAKTKTRLTTWFQGVPNDPGVKFSLHPISDIGPTPDSKVLAEGDPFVFCVGPLPGNAACELYPH